jgi:hypothetical protein
MIVLVTPVMIVNRGQRFAGALTGRTGTLRRRSGSDHVALFE